ncbi:glycosyltransferase family 2 protein [Aequorivita echinoideorum]|uniref:Glycosyltransferase family 2 protein n=1 Tax=Aequorivita echinoideorum TaxID=1549647 RepID=A0ABS5S637_9FLAO|nr:glycosyltransferase family A protein [Aequorivita echinoideorum]MBT0608448.1 glycosyltransferase family 2 protein [Aequorivita echinoideorum]
MDDFISIILPVYNGEKYLEEAIESCLSQTHKNLELIIVNDCSTDASGQIAEFYKDKDARITVIHNKINQNLPASLNIGHSAAIGKYITWTSDDNILKSNFLEEMKKPFSDERVDIVFSDYDVLYENGSKKREHLAGPVSGLIFGNSIGASFLYKKKVFKKIGGYDEQLHTVEDYDFWLRASLISNFYHLNENLYKYRLHISSLTNTVDVDKIEKRMFDEKTIYALKKIGDSLNWNPITFFYFTKAHNLDKFNYFKKYNTIIINDLKVYQCKINVNEKTSVENMLNKQLRILLKNSDVKITIADLFWILRNQPGILLSTEYSKIESLKLLKRFFKN